MVAGRVHRRGRPRVRRADPPAGRGRTSPASRDVLDVGSGEGQVARAGGGRRGRDPGRRDRPRQGPARGRAGSGPAGRSTPGRRRVPCRSRERRSTRSSPASCSSTSTTSTAPSPRWAGCSRRGGRFLFFLNHPLLQTPGIGWIDDHILERAVLAHRPVPRRGHVAGGGGEGRVPPLRPPAAVPLRERAGRRGPGHPAHGGAAPPPGFLARARSTPTPPPSPASSSSGWRS